MDSVECLSCNCVNVPGVFSRGCMDKLMFSFPLAIKMLSDSHALNLNIITHSTLEMNADRGKYALKSRIKIHSI